MLAFPGRIPRMACASRLFPEPLAPNHRYDLTFMDRYIQIRYDRKVYLPGSPVILFKRY